ncbi:hypothetical protein BDF14DRAFT_1705150, partial [Spinellus fusiger]
MLSSLTFQLQDPQQVLHRLPSPPNSSCGDDLKRRDSTPTHFDVTTLQEFSTLPENYTIDHSHVNKHHPKLHKPSSVVGKIPHKRTFEPYRRYRDSSQTSHRCEQCGKVYKHFNCLVKHRWEHSEEWELTSKLLLTKHQQVQMLEAAAILMSMD